MKNNKIKISLPLNFNFIIFKKKNLEIILIIFNKKFNFKIFLKKKLKIKLNKNLNYIELNNKNINENFLYIKNNFFYFLEKLNTYYFTKIKFKGKGYKLSSYKNIKILNFFFGKSHKSIIFYKNIKIKKIKKYKLILMNNNFNILKKISCKIVKIKKINEYTNRGLRMSRQIIIKRKGKKGSFV